MMRRKQSAAVREQPVEYREESARREIMIMLILAVLIAAPLLWASWKIETEGSTAANIKPYLNLTLKVDRSVESVYAKLKREKIDIKATDTAAEMANYKLELLAAQARKKEEQKVLKAKDIEVSGIVWNPDDPLVIIGRDVYRKGDSIEGCEIIKVDKTEVTFRDTDGGIVVKYFYEYLK